jgi:hypothetical protein
MPDLISMINMRSVEHYNIHCLHLFNDRILFNVALNGEAGQCVRFRFMSACMVSGKWHQDWSPTFTHQSELTLG